MYDGHHHPSIRFLADAFPQWKCFASAGQVSRSSICAVLTAVLVLVANGTSPSSVMAQQAQAASDEAELQRFEAQHVGMGVRFRIVGYGNDEDIARQAVRAAFDRIDELNRIFSDYDPKSEIRQLIELPTGKFHSVSPELASLLVTSAEIHDSSGGAFDVSVGPLSKIWREAREKKRLPEEQVITDAAKCVGMNLITVNPSSAEVRISKDGVSLDFGGIAKGYAADEALRVLREAGIEYALVDASGDITFGTPPPTRTHWNAEVARLEADGKPSRRIAVKEGAIATSGDAWQYIELEGKRFSHILDPRTGWPIEGRSSVTVIAPTGTQADAWASAFSVMGHEKGVELANELDGIEVLFVILIEGTAKTFESSGFQDFDAK